jgi:CheY-like chemotaxis protein
MTKNANIHRVPYKQVSILVVDDDEVDVESFRRTLSKLKIANPVYRARDGIEALEMLKSNNIPQPYIILLDINMPRMNGLEFLEHIRTDSALTSSVVFILTTSTADEDIFEAYRLHVAGYISKKDMDTHFLTVVGFLDHYWRIVELPTRHAGG